MSRESRCLVLFVLVSIFPIFGCGSGNAPTPTPAKDYQIVVFSDLHFDPFYDQTLFPRLSTSDPTAWEAIFKSSSTTAPSSWGADTNYPLLITALDSIGQNLETSPVILYTGDTIAHNFPKTYFTLCECQDVAGMEAFTDKTFAFVAAEIRSHFGDTPVLFAVGNIDSYIGDGPDSTYLANNAGTFYTQFLESGVDQTTFMGTFKTGGYYSAAILQNRVLVIGLNTNPLAVGIPANTPPRNNDAAVDTELEWLDTTLAAAQAAGQKVWLLMHIPPGLSTVPTVTTPSDFGSNGELTEPTMTLLAKYQQEFLGKLAKYPGLITMALGAHTHMDEYRILSPSIVLEQMPSITPWLGGNPAFKILTVTNDTFTPTDYRSLNYDLSTLPGQFNNYYTFSTIYALQGPLSSSLLRLYPQIVANPSTQELYTTFYNSGNDHYNPVGKANWNPITPKYWPVFACSISEMDQTDLTGCVKAY